MKFLLSLLAALGFHVSAPQTPFAVYDIDTYGVTPIDLPDYAPGITEFKIGLQVVVTHWGAGMENTGLSWWTGYASWDYTRYDRFPYPEELGQDGDTYFQCTPVISGFSPGAVVQRQQVMAVGPLLEFDGVVDYQGSSGMAVIEFETWTQEVVFSITDPVTLLAIEAGADLDLHTEALASIVMGSNGAASCFVGDINVRGWTQAVY